MAIIHNQINGLTKAEQKLLNYIEKNLLHIEELTIRNLAEQAEVSTATVSRLAKKFGYSNFAKFKLELSKTKYDNLYNGSILSNDSLSDLVLKLASSYTESIKQTVELLKIEELEQASTLLNQASKIYLFGVGASGTVCSDFYYKLNRIGKNCVYVQDSHVQMASIASASSKDLAIGISYSGLTKEVVAPLQFAKKQRVFTIAITGVGLNPLTQLGDLVFRVPKHEQEVRVGAIDSRNNTLFLTDLLYLAMIQKDSEQLGRLLEDTQLLTKSLKY